MECLKGLHPKNRIGCAFGSYGWSGVAIQSLQNTLASQGGDRPAFAFVVYAPDEDSSRLVMNSGKKWQRSSKRGKPWKLLKLLRTCERS